MTILIAGVGYTYLRDLSFGPEMVKKLLFLEWPEGVEVEDLSYGPVAVIQKLTEIHYQKIILVGAAKKGRKPGTIYKYRLNGDLPDPEEIQERMLEGVAGVISLDSLLILCKYYGVFPEDVEVIEVEPEDESWGEGFTLVVHDAMDKVIQMVRAEVGIT